MARGRSDGEALAFMRMRVLESAINTLTEAQATTPVNMGTLQAMRIWRVQFVLGEPTHADPGADTITTRNTITALSLRQNLTVIPAMRDNGVIAIGRMDAVDAGLAAGGGINTAIREVNPLWAYSPGGVLVGSQTLSLYIQSVQGVAVAQSDVVIQYTLETLGQDEFFALVSLLATIS